MPKEFNLTKEEFEYLDMDKEMEHHNKAAFVFNRNGCYYDRKTRMCWIETPHGCWEYDFEMFEYKLGLHDHKMMSPRERNAVQTLINLNVCPKELKKKLWWDDRVRELNDIHWAWKCWARKD
jgi:hypothetical protein